MSRAPAITSLHDFRSTNGSLQYLLLCKPPGTAWSLAGLVTEPPPLLLQTMCCLQLDLNEASRHCLVTEVLPLLQTVYCLELDLNEAAVSLTLVKFAAWPQEGWVLAVGTVQSLTFYPRELKDGFIRLYRCTPRWLLGSHGFVGPQGSHVLPGACHAGVVIADPSAPAAGS